MVLICLLYVSIVGILLSIYRFRFIQVVASPYGGRRFRYAVCYRIERRGERERERDREEEEEEEEGGGGGWEKRGVRERREESWVEEERRVRWSGVERREGWKFFFNKRNIN